MVSKFTAKRADLLQTWAPHMTRKLVELGGDPDRILTLPKGVDTDLFNPAPAPSEKRILISTRQLRPEYHHDVALQAFAIARRTVPGIRYVLCGGGPIRAELEQLAADLGITDAVDFLGHVPHPELPRRLRDAQVYVSMQHEDGVSSSLLEAMACGAFPIVTDIEPNHNWVRNCENGFLVAVGDVNGLATRIVDAFENTALRLEARAENLEAVAARGSMASNMRQMERHYRLLLSSGQAAHA
jgi:glycosyltransferase involved in cell wall biosynthesis